MYYNVATDTEFEHQDVIYSFNRHMEKMACVSRLNETVLVELLDLLEDTCPYKSRPYWLSLARINELAMICAGNYAENCEFRLVGDLMINPRRVLVHVRGRSQPVLKQRHTLLTEQFSHMAGTRSGVIKWLKTRAIVENRIPAILPHLLSQLRESGVFRESYLSSIESRQMLIADLSSYLACQGFESREALNNWCRDASLPDRNLVKSMLCEFDFQQFDLLGKDLQEMRFNHGYKSIFLKSSEKR